MPESTIKGLLFNSFLFIGPIHVNDAKYVFFTSFSIGPELIISFRFLKLIIQYFNAQYLLSGDYTTAKVENDESQWIENEATAKTASATNLRGSDY